MEALSQVLRCELNDRVTMETLHNPYVASDGHTYDLETLLQLSKRGMPVSPMTREPLRPWVYPSNALSELPPRKPCCLYNHDDREYNMQICLDLTALPAGPLFQYLFERLPSTELTIRAKVDMPDDLAVVSYEPVADLAPVLAELTRVFGLQRFRHADRWWTCPIVGTGRTVEDVLIDNAN